MEPNEDVEAIVESVLAQTGYGKDLPPDDPALNAIRETHPIFAEVREALNNFDWTIKRREQEIYKTKEWANLNKKGRAEKLASLRHEAAKPLMQKIQAARQTIKKELDQVYKEAEDGNGNKEPEPGGVFEAQLMETKKQNAMLRTNELIEDLEFRIHGIPSKSQKLTDTLLEEAAAARKVGDKEAEAAVKRVVRKLKMKNKLAAMDYKAIEKALAPEVDEEALARMRKFQAREAALLMHTGRDARLTNKLVRLVGGNHEDVAQFDAEFNELFKDKRLS